MAGTGRAAEIGILFKGGEVFERARRVDAMVLDKTGTITEGAMRLSRVVSAGTFDEHDLLALAAATERPSEHPIARAVVDGAAARGIEPSVARDFAAMPGAGATALVDGHRVTVGRADGLPPTLTPVAGDLAAAGQTVFAVSVDGRVEGVIAVADTLKPDARAAVDRLRAMGSEVVLLTGDRRDTAESIAAAAGIGRVVAEARPETKVDEIDRLRQGGRRVAFAGDGINDAPALAAADLGIAMGGGTDVAIEAADVTVLRSDVDAIPDALDLARRTYRVIVQNLVWAFGYNVVMIPLAVAGLLTPMWAAGAMAASSVSVVANALRLRRFGHER
jgi:Cu+-exporting ATPase